MAYIFGAIIGYLFGCVNMAYFIAKSKGIDIKKVGSNNPGASNVFISVSKAAGVAVGACDILKSFFAAELTFLLFSGNFEAAIIAGAAAVIGHDFPFWMKFKGGKGLAPFMGVILFYDWRIFLAFVVIITAIILITDYIVIGTFTVTAFMPLYEIFIKKDLALAAIFLVLAGLIWFMHRENMKRIIKGTEIGFRRKNVYKKQ